MAGRGRGGKSSFLTKEQLQSLGVGSDKSLPVVTIPPPTFPPLITQPFPLTKDSEDANFHILWKKRFLNHMRESTNIFNGNGHNTDVPMKASTSILKTETQTKKGPFEFNRHLMPRELFPDSKKRKMKKPPAKQPVLKKPFVDNIDERLKQLEEKEKMEPDTEKTENKSDSENEDEENIDGDDEMDDENDYGVSYFDNGEAYNEEDDNLDDGPVY